MPNEIPKQQNNNGATEGAIEDAYSKLVDAATARKRFEKAGKSSLESMALTSVTLDEESKKKYVHGLISGATKEWREGEEAKRDAELAKKKGMSLEEYKEYIEKGNIAQRLAKKFPTILGSFKLSVKSTRMLAAYRKATKAAIKANNGNIAAGAIAIEEFGNMFNPEASGQENAGGNTKVKIKDINQNDINERVKARLDKGEGDDLINALVGRAEAAASAGEDNEDTDVKVERLGSSSFANVRNKKYEDLTSEEKKRRAIAEYTEEIVKTKNPDDKTLKELREKFLREISAIDSNGQNNNYGKIADNIAENLAGTLSEEMAKEEHQNALRAIDKYLDQTISISNATVSVGLAAKEVCADLRDNATLRYGLIAGVAAAIAIPVIRAISKKAAAGAIFAGAPGLVGAAIAAAAGGIIAADREKNIQRRKNIERATSVDDSADLFVNAGVNKKNGMNQYSILNSEKIAQHMRSLIGEDGKLKSVDENGKAIDINKQYENALWKIAEIRARNKIQNEKRIQLIGYKGRNSIEQQKCEMFEAINELKRAMRNTDPERAKKLNDEIKNETEKHEGKLDEEINEVKKNQRKEVGLAAFKGASIGGALAGFSSFLPNILQGTGIGNLIEKISPSNGIFGIHNTNIPTVEGLESPAGDNLPYVEGIEPLGEGAPSTSSGAVLIDSGPDGKISILIDSNGDGTPDTIFGENVDLTDDEACDNLRAELADKYNIDLQRESIDASRYGEIRVSDYLEKAGNTVDNSGGVDWSKSALRVGFGSPTVVAGDGMDTYEVPVWGLNGGGIPDGAKLYIDLDGDNGPGQALEFTIENGKVRLPADVLDTHDVGNGGTARFIGTVRIGEMQGNTMISYATVLGERADASTMISAASDSQGYAFTAVDMNNGERLSQFAVNASNQQISNLSEIYNGINDRLPATFTVNDIDGNTEAVTLAGGAKVAELDYSGGYHPEYDSFRNTPFIEGRSFLGTPIHWDLDGDGIMSPEEQASYFQQMLVRTGTDPYMLGQNASNYGLLEPDRLAGIIPRETLIGWGIADGIVDSETDLNTLLENLKLPENAAYYDKLVNATINEMQRVMQGGSFEVSEISNRTSTYANSNGDLDTVRANTHRVGIIPRDANGNPVGNRGWWCRKYGVEGGVVYDMPLCDQKGIKAIINRVRSVFVPPEDTTNGGGIIEEGGGDDGNNDPIEEGGGDDSNDPVEEDGGGGISGGGSSDNPPDNPPDNHTPKNVEAEIKYAGDATPMDVDQSKASTEADHEIEEAINRQSVERQASSDTRAAEQAAKTAKDQAISEQEARGIAEERRVVQEKEYDSLSPEDKAVEDAARGRADRAEENATAAATRTQESANIVTRQVEKDAATGETAQKQADAAASKQQITGETKSQSGTLTASDFAKAAQQES